MTPPVPFKSSILHQLTKELFQSMKVVMLLVLSLADMFIEIQSSDWVPVAVVTGMKAMSGNSGDWDESDVREFGVDGEVVIWGVDGVSSRVIAAEGYVVGCAVY
jgi:hypothetical protein